MQHCRAACARPPRSIAALHAPDPHAALPRCMHQTHTSMAAMHAPDPQQYCFALHATDRLQPHFPLASDARHPAAGQVALLPATPVVSAPGVLQLRLQLRNRASVLSQCSVSFLPPTCLLEQLWCEWHGGAHSRGT
eukprot:364116-Chlamydomonas_euryale.AAC.2